MLDPMIPPPMMTTSAVLLIRIKQTQRIPLLKQERWLRHQEKAPVPKRRRRGGRSHATFRRTDHPGRAIQWRLRSIYLMARPPLLSKEGNKLSPTFTPLIPPGTPSPPVSHPDDRHPPRSSSGASVLQIF